jgi:hypothetical protein
MKYWSYEYEIGLKMDNDTQAHVGAVWSMIQCSLYESANVSEGHTASFFMVVVQGNIPSETSVPSY